MDNRLRRLPISGVSPLLPDGSRIIPDVPVESFTALRMGVYEQLYLWLTKEHGLSDHGPDRLHSRTFVGGQLADRLESAERQRLRATEPQATKDEIEKLLAWSNGNSGPHGCVAGTNGLVYFDGDACFVVPHEHVLGTGLDEWRRRLADSYVPARRVI